MNKIHRGQAILMALLLFPFYHQAQQYNHLYDYHTDHFNSDHLCAEQIAEKYMIVGSSLEGPIHPRNMQLSVVHTTFGTSFPTTYTYAVGDFPTRAVDLVQSAVDKKFVITTNNYLPYDQPHVGMNVVKVNPGDGSIAWARHFGQSEANFHAKAIARNDKKEVYYVLGERDFSDHANSIFTSHIYLLAIDDKGTTLWERLYTFDEKDPSNSAVDLIYHPGKDVVVITGRVSGKEKNGAVIAEIDPGNGAVQKAALIPEIGGEKSFLIRDMTVADDRYMLVGDVYPASTTYGFLLQIEPGLTPYSSFSRIYAADRASISMRGIRKKVNGYSYACFEYKHLKEPLYPAMMELDKEGNVKSSFLYDVKNYDGISGLVEVFDGHLMVIKGGTKPIFSGGSDPALSLISVKTPLSEDEEVCAKKIGIEYDKGAKLEELTLKEIKLETVKRTTVVVKEIKMDVDDCHGQDARLAPSDLSIFLPSEKEEVYLYPNPTEGIANLELNEIALDQYRIAEVFNSLGKVVSTFRLSSTVNRIDLSSQAHGIYLVRLKSDDGALIRTERLLVR